MARWLADGIDLRLAADPDERRGPGGTALDARAAARIQNQRCAETRARSAQLRAATRVALDAVSARRAAERR